MAHKLDAFKDSRVLFDDTTLRDGEQTAGVVFSMPEKIRIAQLLDELGVQQIEVGIPTMGEVEKETIKRIAKLNLKASLLGWNRALVKDVEHSLEVGVDAVTLSISVSDIQIKNKLQKDRDWVLKNVAESVEYAKKQGLYVNVTAEDASRADFEFLVKFAQVVRDHGGDRLRYADTLGFLNPIKTYNIIKQLIERVPGIDIEMHMHNDLGMAVANTVAGILAGARWANVTVGGLGERAGNAALEEVAMALKLSEGIDHGLDSRKFKETVEYVWKAAGRFVVPWKAIVGDNVFAHESGIHADGVLKDPKNYELFSPEEVGLQRKIVIGKHSGTAAVIAVLRKFGVELDRDEANELLKRVRKYSMQVKRPLTEQELYFLYQDYKSGLNVLVD